MDISWGRNKAAPEKRSIRSKADVPGICAVVCAVVCAVSLCAFTLRGAAAADSAPRITYNEPERQEAWSLWGYFSGVLENAFGIG